MAQAKKTDSNALSIFERKVRGAMDKIDNLEEFRKSDSMVNYIFDLGHKLFDEPLDTMGVDTLIRHGGRLVGAYGYLGQKSAYARAERDVYEQKTSEVEKELVLDILKENEGYKVTKAKAEVAAEIEPLKELAIQKEAVKNQWENVTDACDKMVSFIQSAIKVKEGERFKSGRLSD